MTEFLSRVELSLHKLLIIINLKVCSQGNLITTLYVAHFNDIHCVFQIHSNTTTLYEAVQEFNVTYSVEVAACTQAGSGMVSPRVWLFVPEDSKLLY